MQTLSKIFTLSALGLSAATAKTEMQMPLSTEISPNGQEIVFAWKSDIWKVSAKGGRATKVTTHPSSEYRPIFAPDGKSIYFNSTRKGGLMVFKKDLVSGEIKQITHHTEATLLEDVAQDGKSLLIRGYRDHGGRNPARLFTTKLDGTDNETLLFDASVKGGKLSPDGKKVLFTREGVESYRKQYKGTQAGQIWIFDKESGEYTQPVSSEYGVRWPLWAPDGKSFYYVSQKDLTFNLYHHDLSTKKDTQLTFYKDDGVILPTISDDGSTIAFRVLFDLYTLKTTAGSKPNKIEIYHTEVDHDDPIKNVAYNKTKDADFTPSGLEIAFSANDDLYVMDTILREPVEIGRTSAIEKNLAFINKGKTLLYIKDDGDKTSICKVEKKDPSQFWWEASEFVHNTVYESKETLQHFNISPDGKSLAISNVKGEVIITDINGKKPKTIITGWQVVYPTWSPDSKWLTYSQQDNNFNADIFIIKADGSEKAINLSQHPDNEYAPTWSPDGKSIAFIGRRFGSSYDLFVAKLYPKEKSARSSKIASAKKAMTRDPIYKKPAKTAKKAAPKKDPKLKIKIIPRSESFAPSSIVDAKKEDFVLKGITSRFKRIRISGSPSDIQWSHDSKKILVQTRGGKTIMAYPADGGRASKFADASGPAIRQEKSGKLFMLNKGIPAVVSGGRATNYTFKVITSKDRRDVFRLAFRQAWRVMGDGFYDTAMNNRDWDKVLKKYDNAAAKASDTKAMERIVHKMLGELNASHTGFTATPWNRAYKAPSQLTKIVHIGVQFDQTYKGEGLKISHVFPNSNATKLYSKLEKGEIITSVNGKALGKETSQISAFNLNPSKEIALIVKAVDGKERNVNIAPSNFIAARELGKAERIDQTEEMVNKLSDGKLGYVHVALMMWDEFEKFERHIYEKGYGKEGLIIDVRDNGGGFTTDHLLTVLNQKRHAFTIPRNGGPGYPQDRIVYATWEKPIIVLCNQNSFSNAEIFSHAIKALKRGRLVGVQTAGGVISTGAKTIPNAGTLRYPFRGWFSLKDGADMEMNGAMPDVTIWPMPGALNAGVDKQLEKAVEMLKQDVKNTPPLHGKAIYKSTLPQ